MYLIFLVFSFLEKSLHHYKEGGVLSLTKANRFFIQVLEAVNFCHEKGITHNDIKARNVLVLQMDGVDHAQLTDFEFAERSGHDTGRRRGTPFFMPPKVTGLGY